MEVPHTPGKVLGYVAMWWSMQVGVSWVWVGVPIMTQETAGGIWTKFGMEVPHTTGKTISYVLGVEGGRGMGVGCLGNTDLGNH